MLVLGLTAGDPIKVAPGTEHEATIRLVRASGGHALVEVEESWGSRRLGLLHGETFHLPLADGQTVVVTLARAKSCYARLTFDGPRSVWIVREKRLRGTPEVQAAREGDGERGQA